MKAPFSVEGIRYLREKVDDLSQRLEETSSTIVRDIAQETFTIANNYNASAPQSGVEKSTVEMFYTENSNKASVSLIGKNAIYDEYGTGEQGASNPHPMKSMFNLNPYNSGEHIFYNQLANRYQWRYSPMSGRPYFTDNGLTEGIPSGQQMYKTLNDIRKKNRSIVKKDIENAIARLK